MKKHTLRLLSAILSVTTLMSTFGSVTSFATEISDSNDKQQQATNTQDYRATGDLTLEEGEIPKDVTIIDSASEYYKIRKKNLPNSGQLLLNSSGTLPKSVDNSDSEYFPAIGNQGSIGSCVCWAQSYYQYTYTYNKAMNIKTTPDNSFSPKWTYNLVSGGDAGKGSVNTDVYNIMKKIGNVSYKTVPYDNNVTSWSPTEKIWREALSYRIKDYQIFKDFGSKEKQITSPDDEDILAVKTALSNSDVLTFSTCISSWVTSKLKTNSNAPENNSYANEEVVTSQDGAEGGHRMTIVGYNDNIWTDINGNNSVDDGEMGALKIANSWGDGYANNGFIWLAYDALNDESCVEGVENASNRKCPVTSVGRIDVMPYNENSDLYLKYTLNTSYRGSVQPYLIAEKDGTMYSTNIFPNVTMATNDADQFSFDGTTNSNDGTMLYPLYSLIPDITPETLSEYTWSVKFIDNTADGKILTVKDAHIVDESTNTVYKPSNTYPITLEDSKTTTELIETSLNHAVVYYRGYQNAKITYKIGNGSWKTEVMENNLEREGYLHKYVIDLENTNNATLYFSDDNGNVDNNGGKYYTAVKNINYYSTENARTPVTLEITQKESEYLDVNSQHTFLAKANGGYKPYSYQYIFEDLSTGKTDAPSGYRTSSTFTYFPRSEGNYKLTVNVKDYSGAITTATYDFYVEDRPFEIKSFDITSSKNILCGQEVAFTAESKCEQIMYIGYVKNTYDVVIEKNGKTVHTETIRTKEGSLNHRYSILRFNWTPTEAGTYTAKISSTDNNKEYAEATVSFNVGEFNGTLVGDADNNKEINVTDATLVQKYSVELADNSELYTVLSDCDSNDSINIKDATYIQKYIASMDKHANVGTVNYREPEPTTEPTTVPVTEPTTQPTTVVSNKVTFTNSFHWSGTIYCYYWSDSNTGMTSWPGKAMTFIGTNDYGENMYTFEVPDGATYIIFSNGSSQTTDIPYSGGEVRYYPIAETDSNGHNKVKTW